MFAALAALFAYDALGYADFYPDRVVLAGRFRSTRLIRLVDMVEVTPTRGREASSSDSVLAAPPPASGTERAR